MHDWALDSYIESFLLFIVTLKAGSTLPCCCIGPLTVPLSSGSFLRPTARGNSHGMSWHAARTAAMLGCWTRGSAIGTWIITKILMVSCLDNLRKAFGKKTHTGTCVRNLRMISHHWTCGRTTAGLSAKTMRLSAFPQPNSHKIHPSQHSLIPAWITETNHQNHRMRKMDRKPQGRALNINSWAETSQDIRYTVRDPILIVIQYGPTTKLSEKKNKLALLITPRIEQMKKETTSYTKNSSAKQCNNSAVHNLCATPIPQEKKTSPQSSSLINHSGLARSISSKLPLRVSKACWPWCR